MTSIPQDAEYRPEPIITEIDDFIADKVQPANFPETILRYRNDRAASEIGLSALDDDEWIQHFGRFRPLNGNIVEPLALRYHGHQFRNYNADIGDGRGFLFAQMRDRDGRLLDLATKGSGQTPWSRFGDGRLTLKGAVREILATEMLEALGTETSKTLSVIETGEALHRGDEPSPTRSAVLVRMSHSHIRIGSFQRLATLQDDESLMRLVAYALKHYFGEPAGSDAPAKLLSLIVARTARLAASYVATGFVHGVLNTDNINITGESFDYGPWRWTPYFDGGFTAAYFDESGLYAFGRQAEAIHWNLVQLAIAFSRISDQDPLIEAINGYAPAYQTAIVDRMLWRLGVTPKNHTDDNALVEAIEIALSTKTVTIDQFFFDWAGGALRTQPSAEYDAAPFQNLKDICGAYRSRLCLTDQYWLSAQPCTMHIEGVEAIWAPIADRDDWSLLTNKISQIGGLRTAMGN
jgi:serine/tyrosine/threonine adenylyltransferase